ncbi:hypothetical protein CHARACLAT_025898 [Characodon lateralis]|uniref:Uncharacterized protein n=1 Tax=Characodon lateralis TaxID=208331 RepID=A0ABU7CVF5_9TELE|nr:hypothetical protein [Characodon lateralis]
MLTDLTNLLYSGNKLQCYKLLAVGSYDKITTSSNKPFNSEVYTFSLERHINHGASLIQTYSQNVRQQKGRDADVQHTSLPPYTTRRQQNYINKKSHKYI